PGPAGGIGAGCNSTSNGSVTARRINRQSGINVLPSTISQLPRPLLGSALVDCGTERRNLREDAFPRSSIECDMVRRHHLCAGASHRSLWGLHEGWRTREEPYRNHAVENHATERRGRHEGPNGIAPKVMRNIPNGMNQPADSDPAVRA